jgi:hypothetical protein
MLSDPAECVWIMSILDVAVEVRRNGELSPIVDSTQYGMVHPQIARNDPALTLRIPPRELSSTILRKPARVTLAPISVRTSSKFDWP